MPDVYIPNFNTLADAIDRLIVEVLKLSFYENIKREESLKTNPDLKRIVDLDRNSRDSCEFRDMLKREIDSILSTIVESGSYKTLKSNRTFIAPSKSIADLISERCEFVGSKEFKTKLIKALEDTI